MTYNTMNIEMLKREIVVSEIQIQALNKHIEIINSIIDYKIKEKQNNEYNKNA